MACSPGTCKFNSRPGSSGDWREIGGFRSIEAASAAGRGRCPDSVITASMRGSLEKSSVKARIQNSGAARYGYRQSSRRPCAHQRQRTGPSAALSRFQELSVAPNKAQIGACLRGGSFAVCLKRLQKSAAVRTLAAWRGAPQSLDRIGASGLPRTDLSSTSRGCCLEKPLPGACACSRRAQQVARGRGGARINSVHVDVAGMQPHRQFSRFCA